MATTAADLATAAPAADEHVAQAPDRDQEELQRLVVRLQALHPDVALETITVLVGRSQAELAGSRIESFRLILIERAVRRHLGAGPNVER